jgi:hypothetical protein
VVDANEELRMRLERAADLLEALVGGSPLSNELRQDAIPDGMGTDYVDLTVGQMGVSGGIKQVDVGARLALHEAAVREVAIIRGFLASAALGVPLTDRLTICTPSIPMMHIHP